MSLERKQNRILYNQQKTKYCRVVSTIKFFMHLRDDFPLNWFLFWVIFLIMVYVSITLSQSGTWSRVKQLVDHSKSKSPCSLLLNIFNILEWMTPGLRKSRTIQTISPHVKTVFIVYNLIHNLQDLFQQLFNDLRTFTFIVWKYYFSFTFNIIHFFAEYNWLTSHYL